MIVTKRLSVTLANGRAHVLQLPPAVEAATAAEVLCGIRSASEAGWADGSADWLPYEEGSGWVRRDAIVEVAVVDWVEAPTEIY